MAPQLIVTKQWTTSATQPLTEANLDAMKSSIETFFNTTGLDSTNFQDGGIIATNLASTSVTTAKIEDAAVGTSAINDAAVTQAKRADLGQDIDNTPTSVSIVTTGRPVFVGFMPEATEDTNIQVSRSEVIATNTRAVTVLITRTIDATTTTISRQRVLFARASASSAQWGMDLPTSAVWMIDVPAATATCTYALSYEDGSLYGDSLLNGQMVAYEL